MTVRAKKTGTQRMLHPSPKVEKQQLPTCSDEYTTFSTALQKVLKVSHSEMQKRITRASAARASNAKD